MDGFILVGGAIAAIVLSTFVWWWGFVSAYVLAHFFLFCNVVRMARSLELAWACVFLGLAGATIAFDKPGWLTTAVVSGLVTAIVVVIEARKPSYHGVGWRRINPGLRAWWDARFGDKRD